MKISKSSTLALKKRICRIVEEFQEKERPSGRLDLRRAIVNDVAALDNGGGAIEKNRVFLLHHFLTRVYAQIIARYFSTYSKILQNSRNAQSRW